MSDPQLTEDDRRTKLRLLSRSIPLVRDSPPDCPELQVLYEDHIFLVVSKPHGIRTHPIHRFEGGSLLNRALGYLDVPKLHTVHRLDQPTSGLVLFMKNPAAAESVNAQFRSRTIKKEYLAIVDLLDTVPDTLLSANVLPIDYSIARHPSHKRRRIVDDVDDDAKPGRTLVSMLASSTNHGLVVARPLSGRTHQIRLHLAEQGMPIVGDDLYGVEASKLPATEEGSLQARAILEATGNKLREHLKLHAHRLCLTHPDDHRPMEFIAPPPDHFTQAAHEYDIHGPLNSSRGWIELP